MVKHPMPSLLALVAAARHHAEPTTPTATSAWNRAD
jgi:hypothetical protein